MRLGSPERYFTLKSNSYLGGTEANIRGKARKTEGKRTRSRFQPDVCIILHTTRAKLSQMAHLLTIPVIYIIGTQIIRNHHHWKHQQTVVYVPSVHYIQHRFMWNSEFRQFNKTADSKSGAERCPTQNKTKETGTNQHHTKLARQDSPHFRCSAVFI